MVSSFEGRPVNSDVNYSESESLAELDIDESTYESLYGRMYD